MSHYPGTWKYPDPEFDFDRWMISELEQGNSRALLDMTVQQLDEVGNTELLTWAVLLGAVGSQRAKLVQYTPTWHHGHAMIQFIPAAETSIQAPLDSGPSYGGYEFQNKGFEFYRHPPASAYAINKLLFDVRHDAELRLRLLIDPEAVASEYDLPADQKQAIGAIAAIGSATLVSESAELLVKSGAHPIHALMSLHAVHGEFKKLQSASLLATEGESGS